MARGLRDGDRKCSRDTGNKMAASSLSLSSTLSWPHHHHHHRLGAVTSSYRTRRPPIPLTLPGRGESVRPLSRPPPSPIALENRRAKLTLHCPYSEDLARVSSRIMAGSRRDTGSARRVTTAGGESDIAHYPSASEYGAYNPRDFKRRRAL